MNPTNHDIAARVWSKPFSIDNVKTIEGKHFRLFNSMCRSTVRAFLKTVRKISCGNLNICAIHFEIGGWNANCHDRIRIS